MTELQATQEANSSTDELTPRRAQPTVVLPPTELPTGYQPGTADSVIQIYPEGIEFASQIDVIRGYLSTIGIIGLPVLSLGIFAFGSLVAPYPITSFIAIIFFFFLIFVVWTMLRIDFNGFRYTPVLLNRALGKVHVFEDLGMDLLKVWKLWGSHKYAIHTHDWNCVRGEVVQMVVQSGSGFRTEFGLSFAVTETPGSQHVITRFGVGTTSAYDQGAAMIRRWEHIRRFMRHEGPLMQPGDRLFQDWGVEFWSAIFDLQPLLGPGSGEHWKSGTWYVYIAGVWMMILLPLTMLMGFMRWLSYRLKVDPQWPNEIIASVGGRPLTPQEIEDMTKIVAGPRQAVKTGKKNGKRKSPKLGKNAEAS